MQKLKPTMGDRANSIAIDLFGNALNLLPTLSADSPIAITVAGHFCDKCKDFNGRSIESPCQTCDPPCGVTFTDYPPLFVYPVLVGKIWNHYPCHIQICVSCEQESVYALCPECHSCLSCCTHATCWNCDEKVNPWEICSDDAHHGNQYCVNCCFAHGDHDSYDDSRDYESDADRYCDDCVSPGWKFRGWTLGKEKRRSVDDRLAEAGCNDFNPAEAMATFYLLDYIAARSTANDPISIMLKREALEQQAVLVRQVDAAFREYMFMAIGGELRHHSHVQGELGNDSARTKAAGYWMALGDKYGRLELLADAIELFHDSSHHAWPSRSFGGKLWGTAAEILLMRENGRIDPKTFVDRVFSLQHNSGSILDKVGWARSRYSWYHPKYENNPTQRERISEFEGWDWSADNCTLVGEAHAAIVPDLALLTRLADDKAADLYKRAHIANNKARRAIGQPIEPMAQPYAPRDGRRVLYAYSDALRAKQQGYKRTYARAMAKIATIQNG